MGQAYSESPRNWPFGFSAIPWYQHTAPMGRSVTYQFTKSTPAVNAPCSQLGARAQDRGMPRNSQDYSRWTKPREGADPSPVKGSEKEQISGESLLVGAGCLSNDKLSISGPRRPEQQVHWLRWEIFLTLVMSDKTHTTDAATGRESHWHMHPLPPTPTPTWALLSV